MILVPGYLRKSRSGFSSGSFRPSAKGWAWAWPSPFHHHLAQRRAGRRERRGRGRERVLLAVGHCQGSARIAAVVGGARAGKVRLRQASPLASMEDYAVESFTGAQVRRWKKAHPQRRKPLLDHPGPSPQHSIPSSGSPCSSAEPHLELSGQNQAIETIADLHNMGTGASLPVPYGAFRQDPVICLCCRIL